MASKAQTAPTTPRAPKRTTEQQLTDVATKLLAKLEERRAKMLKDRADYMLNVSNINADIPALEKQIAAQRAALGLDGGKEK